ncbi:Uncharacterised protein [Mycobacteroides abscessus subsp. abscessus]|nr:Uncharacterised protein [Mycobacteroides abscessus subsp. abscessus]
MMEVPLHRLLFTEPGLRNYMLAIQLCPRVSSPVPLQQNFRIVFNAFSRIHSAA